MAASCAVLLALWLVMITVALMCDGQVSKLKEETSQNNGSCEILKKEVAVEHRVDIQCQEHQKIRKMIDSTNKTISTLIQEIEDMKTTIAENYTTGGAHSEDVDKLVKEIHISELQITAFTQEMRDLEIWLAVKNKTGEVICEHIQELKHQIRTKIAKVLDLEERLTQIFHQIDVYIDSERQLNSTIHNLQAEIETENKEIQDKQQKVQQLDRGIQESQQQVQQLEDKVKQCSNAKVIVCSPQHKQQFEPMVSTLSKEGYDYVSGFGYYKYHSQARTWDDAVQVCRSEGAHLGIVNSVEEAKVYTSIIASQGATNNIYFHSGFKEIGRTRQFQTLDGCKLSESGYSVWDNGEPNQSYENCGTISRSAKLNDIDCSGKYPFICELEVK